MKRFVIAEMDEDLTRDLLKEFHSAGEIEIVKWYTTEENQKYFYDLPAAERFVQTWRKGFSYRPVLTEEEEHRLFVLLDYLMANFARDTEFYRLPYYEYKHVIHMIANHFAETLQNVRAEAVLFRDIPHGPFISVLYAVARVLHLQTYFLVCSERPDFFHICTSVEDYGVFEIQPPRDGVKADIVHLEKTYQKNLSYMTPERIREDLGESTARKLRLFTRPRAWLKERWFMLKRHGDKYESAADFLERRFILGISRYFHTKQFQKDIVHLETKDIDWTAKYVYFPLHLQPEMTTDTLGGYYRDQLLAIEQLVRILPEGWMIYVKENPKQLFWMREKYFFKRLSSLPQVRYVSRSVDTYRLMEHAQLVATITGTAGWEAISGGKPVIVFGHTWYKNFPGVFTFSDDLDVASAAGYRIVHRDVEAALSAYRAKAWKGVFRSDCLRDAAPFDLRENQKHLVRAMQVLFAKLDGESS